VREFLEHFQLHSTLAVFVPEASLDGGYPGRAQLAQRLGIHGESGLPLLMSMMKKGGELKHSSQHSPSGLGRQNNGVCAYLADVEGNIHFFERYIAVSKVLEWADAGKTKLRFQNCDDCFVFGGDSQDKGIGDIRFTKMMLALKKDYPDRVQLIIGNRDANKLRLTSELQEHCIKDDKVLTDASFPYWDPPDKRVTPQMFLDKNAPENGGSKNTAANRLRYILEETMGAAGAFDRRRQELSILAECSLEQISDDDVVESYRIECDPHQGHNFMFEYLKLGKLAYVHGSTLFVHGALSSKNKGTVPGTMQTFGNVHEWVDALNNWAKKEVDEFESDPYSGKNRKDRNGAGLIDYGVPGGNEGATVVYDNLLVNGNAVHTAPDVQEYLLKNHIRNVVSGHQPHGDCPCVIRTGNVTMISTDTSYSQMGSKSWWGADNRGVDTVTEVLLHLDGSLHVHGVIADGTKIEYHLAGDGGGGGDQFVGRQLSDCSWVKAKTAGNAPEYIICKGEGRKMTVTRKTESEMKSLTSADFFSGGSSTPPTVSPAHSAHLDGQSNAGDSPHGLSPAADSKFAFGAGRCVYVCMCTRTRTRTRAHARTRTPTPTLTYAHTYTHTLVHIQHPFPLHPPHTHKQTLLLTESSHEHGGAQTRRDWDRCRTCRRCQAQRGLKAARRWRAIGCRSACASCSRLRTRELNGNRRERGGGRGWRGTTRMSRMNH